jgi:hypothetical protein
VFISAPTSCSVTLKSCPDPLYRGLPVPYQRKFVPLGKVVQVESNDSAVVDAAAQSFARYGEPPTAARPQIVIQLCIDGAAHDEGPWPVPVYRARQHLFHIGCGNSNFAVADLMTGTAIGFVSREMVSETSFFRYTFLECLFHVLAVHQSHTPVHCACVSWRNRGVLICGRSGAGKTTLAYACARMGMQVVSDDVIHLEWNPTLNRLMLWGNPWQLRLLAECKKFFPELDGESLRLRSDGGWYFEIDVLRQFPGQAQTSCEPVALVFLERSLSTGAECIPLDSALALGRLKQDIVLDDESVVDRHYALLKRLANVGTYTLSYSGHPFSAVTAIRRLLGD